MSETPKRILVGKIVAAHGIRGEVKILSYMEDPQSIVTLATLTDASGQRSFRLKLRGEAKDALIVAIDGVTDRNMAETLKPTLLYTTREALPELNEEEGIYLEDLVGMEVRLADGSLYGHVLAVPNYGASDIIEITRVGAPSEMFAFTEVNFPAVDMKTRVMQLILPEEV